MHGSIAPLVPLRPPAQRGSASGPHIILHLVPAHLHCQLSALGGRAEGIPCHQLPACDLRRGWSNKVR